MLETIKAFKNISNKQQHTVAELRVRVFLSRKSRRECLPRWFSFLIKYSAIPRAVVYSVLCFCFCVDELMLDGGEKRTTSISGSA